ncbi:MAG: hypothetical protein KAI73_06540, partial [Rhodospirillaceae bacterium]|nr:hypothetical protein [Rhodospirillaceae bacterium]
MPSGHKHSGQSHDLGGWQKQGLKPATVLIYLPFFGSALFSEHIGQFSHGQRFNHGFAVARIGHHDHFGTALGIDGTHPKHPAHRPEFKQHFRKPVGNGEFSVLTSIRISGHREPFSGFFMVNAGFNIVCHIFDVCQLYPRNTSGAKFYQIFYWLWSVDKYPEPEPSD